MGNERVMERVRGEGGCRLVFGSAFERGDVERFACVGAGEPAGASGDGFEF